MKAAWYSQPGPAEDVLQTGEMDTPVPSLGEVRVRLHASGVNPSDVKKRAGAQPAAPEPGDVIPHSDGAGVIDAVGPNIPETRIGERVWVYQAQYQRRFGTAAEYVVLPVNRVARLPDNASFEVGACMGIPAMTAHRSVFADGPVEGQTLLVTGGSGRVGHYAIQWAKWAGATVISTAGGDDRITLAKNAGADHVFNYRSDNVVEAVNDLTNGAGVDRIVDVEFGKNIQTSVEVLKANSVIATYSSSQSPEPSIPFYPMMFKNVTLRMVLVYNMPEAAKQRAIDDITIILHEESFHHRVAKTVSLENIAEAHQVIEIGGVPGCVVVEVT
ncbi:MAG: NADPH:quinone reductase [Gammaproteobacteria bacterium]|nr:NADPH:quinone reductase [Gammaproteobacteria bacterium]